MKEYIAETNINDTIEYFGEGSVLQHGKLNDRIYLIKLHKNDLSDIIPYLRDLSVKASYSKIFCKVPGFAAPYFIANGFIMEAFIPAFFRSDEDVFFLSKFLNSDRLLNIENDKLIEFSALLSGMQKKTYRVKLAESNQLKQLNSSHAEEIAQVYRKVFDSYPFPVFDPDYILNTMDSHVQYFGIIKNNHIIALASAETDIKSGNAEMTDFATLPEFRGNNLSAVLLNEMEYKMKEQHITTLYTIARLNSIPMNKTFLKLNFKYAGTLIKNTNIAGKIESMNVLFKHLKDDVKQFRA